MRPSDRNASTSASLVADAEADGGVYDVDPDADAVDKDD